MLHALGTPAEWRQAPAVADRAAVRQGLRGSAEPAHEPRRGARVGERDRALGAADHRAALVARERRGEPAHREEDAPPAGQRLADRAGDGGRERLAPQDAARVGDAHGGPGASLRRRHRHAPRPGAPPRFDARRGRSQQQRNGLAGRPLERDVARMHARGAGRLVRGLVLVHEGQDGRRSERGEQRGARAGGEARRAIAQPMPRRGALVLGHARVEPHDAVDPRQPLRPPGRGLDVGRDEYRRALRALDALEKPLLPSARHQELGLRRGRRRALVGDHALARRVGVRSRRRWQERGARRAER